MHLVALEASPQRFGLRVGGDGRSCDRVVTFEELGRGAIPVVAFVPADGLAGTWIEELVLLADQVHAQGRGLAESLEVEGAVRTSSYCRGHNVEQTTLMVLLLPVASLLRGGFRASLPRRPLQEVNGRVVLLLHAARCHRRL